jgi:hypothetical protein
MVIAVEALRDSKNPGDNAMFVVMQEAAKRERYRKMFADLHPEDPVAMVTCQSATYDPDDENEPEPSEPELPSGVNIPTRYTVRELIECLTQNSRDAAHELFLQMTACALSSLSGFRVQAEMQRLGINVHCRVIHMAGFQDQKERDWDVKRVTVEDVVVMLLGLQKPLPGVSMKWFSTNMVEPYPGCGLCRDAFGGVLRGDK